MSAPPIRHPPIDNRDLSTVLAVAKAGSIRGAAEQLNIAPSAISRQIGLIEHRLGVPLFDRLARGVRPTEAGMLVIEHARRMIHDIEFLEQQLQVLRGSGAGRIRIACGEGFAADLMTHVLPRFAARFPKVRYDITLFASDRIVAAVESGDADIGLAYAPVISDAVTSVLAVRQPLAAILPAGHALARRSSLSLKDLRAIPLALLAEGSGVRHLVGRLATEQGLALVPLLETPSIDVLRRFVAAGLGASILPRFAVVAELKSGQIVSRPIREAARLPASAHLLVRAHRRLPVAVDVMMDLLRADLAAFAVGKDSRPLVFS